MTQELKLSANAGDHSGVTTFKPHWSPCVGAGRAGEALRTSWMEQMELVHRECGFEYVRFHGLFHDDMFVYRENPDGSITYNFQYIDEVFDRLLDRGVKPFIELGFTPKDLASTEKTVFWWKSNVSPPKDYQKWANLITAFVEHIISRYGIEECLTWYYEVWNEPNLAPFFDGTKSQYFELYKVSVDAIKAINPGLRVGGPSTSNFVPDARFDGEREDLTEHKTVTTAKDLDALDWKPVWLADFFTYCEENNLPVDFISTHPYPTDWAFDEHGTGTKLTRGVGATPTDLALLRKMVDESAFPKAEIHLTEWSSSSSPRDYTHDYLQAATYVAKANVDSIGSVDSLSYWVFTDIFEESGGGDIAFHGGFGMVNMQGIPKPTFHTYRLLNTLGNQVLDKNGAGIITRSSESGKVSALAYHYPPEVTQTIPGAFDSREPAETTLATGSPAQLTVKLEGLQAGAVILVEVLDQDHGDALSAWKRMGSPEPISREQTQALKDASAATNKSQHIANAEGVFELSLEVAPWSVISVREV
ncbi:MAG: GH39 family glycosyl hydrolase [Opitutaceae bacterium]